MIKDNKINGVDINHAWIEDLEKNFEALDKIIQNKKSYYKTFTIPKKNGKFRLIEQPNEYLKIIQKIIKKGIVYSCMENASGNCMSEYKESDVAHGFLKGRSIVTNAKNHVNKAFIINIDLEDFFLNITPKMVMESLPCDGYGLYGGQREISNYEILMRHGEPDLPIKYGRVSGENYPGYYRWRTDRIVELVTFKGHLPQGAPTSPMISNFVCVDLDNRLLQYCKEQQITYTRYADDLTFSFDKISKVGEYNSELFKIILESGFKPNFKKINYTSKNKRQVVTGVVVNHKLNVPREFHKRVRAILFNWKTKGFTSTELKFYKEFPEKTDFIETLKGWIQHIGNVRGKNDGKYRRFNITFLNLVLRDGL